MFVKFSGGSQAARNRNRGVALIGYGLIVALLSIAAMGATTHTGRHLADCVFPAISDAIAGEPFECRLPGPGGQDGSDEDEGDAWIAFLPSYDVQPGALVTSQPAVAEGFDGSLSANVSGPAGSNPEFSIDGGPWMISGDVPENASVRLRANAPEDYNERITVAFALGGTTAAWRVSAEAQVGAPTWDVAPTLPNGYRDIDGYVLSLSATPAQGRSIAFYEFVEGEVPPGMEYDAAQSRLSGTPVDEGTFSFVLAVEDDGGQRAEREFTIKAMEPPQLASETPPSEITMSRTTRNPNAGPSDSLKMVLMNGDTQSGTNLSSNQTETFVIRFKNPVLLDNLRFKASKSATLRARDENGRMQGISSGKTPVTRLMITDEIHVSMRTGVTSGTFYQLDFGTANPPPTWATPAGAVALVNGIAQSLQLEAASDSPWDPDLTFTVVSSNDLPAGVSLSKTGLITISPSAEISDQLFLSVRATDGVGFYAERGLSLLPNLQLASQTPPSEIEFARTTSNANAAPSQSLKMALMNGDTSSGVGLSSNRTETFVVRFQNKVLLDEVRFQSSKGGTIKAITSDGSKSISSGSLPLHRMVATDELRISIRTGVTSGTLYRLDFGAANPPPVWLTPSGVIAKVDGNHQEVQLEASSESPFDPNLFFELTSGSSLPEGVTLSETGLITIPADTRLNDLVSINVQVSDGVGFYAQRTFRILPDLPLASSMPLSAITMSRNENGTGSNLAATLMNGNANSGEVTFSSSGGSMWVLFGEPVLLDKVRWNINYHSDATLYALVDGRWENLLKFTPASATRTFASHQMVATDKLRVTVNSGVVTRRLRILDFGTANP